MRSKKFAVILALSALALFAAACNTAAPTAAPTEDPKVFQSTLEAAATQAVQTVEAQFTQTEAAKPTEAYVPIASATVDPATIVTPTVPMPTATVFIPTWTLAPTVAPTLAYTWTPAVTATSTKYNCSVSSMDPAAGTKMPKGYDFDGKFTLTNNGSEKWTASDIDFKYVSGTKFQKYSDAVDLGSDVEKGKSYTFTLDFTAPDTGGNYSATWALVRGSSTLCTVQFYYTINN